MKQAKWLHELLIRYMSALLEVEKSETSETEIQAVFWVNISTPHPNKTTFILIYWRLRRHIMNPTLEAENECVMWMAAEAKMSKSNIEWRWCKINVR